MSNRKGGRMGDNREKCIDIHDMGLLYNISSLRSNDNMNYRLASYFKFRYSFGGVCLAIVREVPHRVACEFKIINNLIAVDAFNSNKRYTVAVISLSLVVASLHVRRKESTEMWCIAFWISSKASSSTLLHR